MLAHVSEAAALTSATALEAAALASWAVFVESSVLEQPQMNRAAGERAAASRVRERRVFMEQG
jgi:hypothetical protein